MDNHEFYMQQAIKVAHHHKTPYAALLLEKSSGAYILEANSTKADGKTAHAEMNVIRRMEENKLFDNPSDLILYTTGEPCPMCMGAIIWTGIPTIYYGMSIQNIVQYHKQITISSNTIASEAWSETTIFFDICISECKKLFELYA